MKEKFDINKYNDFETASQVINELLLNLKNKKITYQLSTYTSSNNYNDSNILSRDPIEPMINAINEELIDYNNSILNLEKLLTFLIGSLQFVDTFDNIHEDKNQIKNILANRLVNLHNNTVNLETNITNLLNYNDLNIKDILHFYLSSNRFNESNGKLIEQTLKLPLKKLENLYIDAFINSQTDCNQLMAHQQLINIFMERDMLNDYDISQQELDNFSNLIEYTKCIHTKLNTDMIRHKQLTNKVIGTNTNTSQNTVLNDDKCMTNLDNCGDIQFDLKEIESDIRNGKGFILVNWLDTQINDPYQLVNLLKTDLNAFNNINATNEVITIAEKANNSLKTMGNDNAIKHLLEVNNNNNQSIKENGMTNSLVAVTGINGDVSDILDNKTNMVDNNLTSQYASVKDANNRDIGNKPFSNNDNVNDNNNAVYPNSLVPNNPDLIMEDKSCIGLSEQQCQQQIIDIASDNGLMGAVRNKPLNIKRKRFGRQNNIPNLSKYYQNMDVYDVNEVTPTKNIDFPTSHSTSSHIWTSNNVDDNFNKIDMNMFTKPLIVQKDVKGVTNVFAPMIYIQNGDKYIPQKYDYQMNNNSNYNNNYNNSNYDLLGNDDPSELSNTTSFFEQDNIMIPH
jgi:hypothetical protein